MFALSTIKQAIDQSSTCMYLGKIVLRKGLTVCCYFLIVADDHVIFNSGAKCGVDAILTGSSRSHRAVVSVHAALLLNVCKRD